MNPGGSIKDRSSLGMIKSAIESGELKPNGPVLEGKYRNLINDHLVDLPLRGVHK